MYLTMDKQKQALKFRATFYLDRLAENHFAQCGAKVWLDTEKAKAPSQRDVVHYAVAFVSYKLGKDQDQEIEIMKTARKFAAKKFQKKTTVSLNGDEFDQIFKIQKEIIKAQGKAFSNSEVVSYCLRRLSEDSPPLGILK